MPARLHPGVYVEEVPSGARAIEGVGTSTAIFVGETERGPLVATKITSLSDFERLYGGHWLAGGAARSTLRYAIDAFFQNGGTAAYVLRTFSGGAGTGARRNVIASSPGVWSTQLSVVYAPSTDTVATRFRLFVIYQPPGSSTRVIVERWDRLSMTPTDENYAPDVLQRSLFIRWDLAAAPGTPPTTADGALTPTATDAQVLGVGGVNLVGGTGGNSAVTGADLTTQLGRLEEVTDASLLVVPARIEDGHANNTADQEDRSRRALDYAEARPKQDLFCVADLPRHRNQATTSLATTSARASFANLNATDKGAVYFPWVEVSDPVGEGRDPIVWLGPSSFVAGIYARTDQRRGVWKAPAGLEATVLGARRLEYKILDVHQDDLNPMGIDALRVMPGGGNVVWGARTMRPNTEWRYIPVRRTAIFLRMSIYNGIQWAVFEPNDEPLWAALRLSIGAFMDQLFRQGAFAGRTAREAYFVKCDAETTPESDRIAGVVNVWVGFAPLRPAEFVVVRLSQIVNQKA